MKDCHRDNKLDQFIGKWVKIIDFESTEHMGLLKKYEYGRYILKKSDSDYAFRKGHIKEISELVAGR